MGDDPVKFAVDLTDVALSRARQLHRVGDKCVENRLQLGGRGSNDPQYLTRCSLLLQSFTQFCVTFLQFLEQTYVLDRDHRLGSEGFEKRDLFVGKWSDFGSPNKNHADRNPHA